MIAEICLGLTLGVNVGTYHFERQSEHNNINPGLYVSCQVSPKGSVVLGGYKNSQYNQSYHIGYKYQLWQEGSHGLDLTTGVVTGYTYAKIVPVLLPGYTFKTSGPATIRISFIPPIAKKVDGGMHLSFERSF